MNRRKIYYVYHHVRLSDGLVFYVGKGKDRRYKSKRDRNPWWHHVCNKHGYKTVFIKKGMDEWCAYTIEVIEIAKQRSLGQPLVNQTRGGEGSKGFVPSWRKVVHCSNGMTFESLTAAAKWLVSEGFPRAKASSVSACCLGKVSNCYGLAWWFDGDDSRPSVNAKSIANTHRMRAVVSSTGVEFESLSMAAKWARENINQKYTTSHVCSCCAGRNKSHYGVGWAYKQAPD